MRRSEKYRQNWDALNRLFRRWIPRLTWCILFRRLVSPPGTEIRAVCVSSARTDLCVGRAAVAVPTATRPESRNRHRCLKKSTSAVRQSVCADVSAVRDLLRRRDRGPQRKDSPALRPAVNQLYTSLAAGLRKRGPPDRQFFLEAVVSLITERALRGGQQNRLTGGHHDSVLIMSR
jgi:hypothetical protein